jgi:hypothetical protein
MGSTWPEMVDLPRFLGSAEPCRKLAEVVVVASLRYVIKATANHSNGGADSW